MALCASRSVQMLPVAEYIAEGGRSRRRSFLPDIALFKINQPVSEHETIEQSDPTVRILNKRAYVGERASGVVSFLISFFAQRTDIIIAFLNLTLLSTTTGMTKTNPI